MSKRQRTMRPSVSIAISFLVILLLEACSDRVETGAADNPALTDHVLKSQFPDRERTFSVWVPPSYSANPQQDFPLLMHVVPDQESMVLTRSVVETLIESGQIPEIVIVSLHHSGPGKQEDIFPKIPDSDSPGQAKRFLAHIEQEVLPRVEADYRISKDRILTGWSRFGIFATFSFTENPNLFSGFIVRSSAPGADYHPFLQSRIELLFEGHPELSTVFHASIGTEGNEERRAGAFDQMTTLLEEKGPPTLRWQTSRIEGAGHVDTLQDGLREGLLFYFSEASTDVPSQEG